MFFLSFSLSFFLERSCVLFVTGESAVCNNKPSIIPCNRGWSGGVVVVGDVFWLDTPSDSPHCFCCWLLCNDQLLSRRMFPCQLKKEYKRFFFYFISALFCVALLLLVFLFQCSWEPAVFCTDAKDLNEVETLIMLDLHFCVSKDQIL